MFLLSLGASRPADHKGTATVPVLLSGSWDSVYRYASWLSNASLCSVE